MKGIRVHGGIVYILRSFVSSNMLNLDTNIFHGLECSNFSDIFDVDYFIKALANDVRVIKKLPKSMKTERKVMKAFRSWSSTKYYEEEIGRLWQNYKVGTVMSSSLRLT